MEVHAHAHTHGKKNWKSYFWEFLMLFLAVFCGFLAEYQLEHKIEKDREKDYIKTMISDLGVDTSTLNRMISLYNQKGVEIDSFIYLLNTPEIKKYGAELYYYGRVVNRFLFFYCADRTIEQMKNSGAFRLISKEQAASGIVGYYGNVNKLILFQNNTSQEAEGFTKSDSKILFNPLVFETMVNDRTLNDVMKPAGNPLLLTYDKSALLNVTSTLHYLQGSRRALLLQYTRLKELSVNLMKLLKKEYHL